MSQSRFEKIGIVEKSTRLAAAAESGHVVLKGGTFFSGSKQSYDIGPDNEVIVYSATSTLGDPGYFTSCIMPGCTLHGVLRRTRSGRRVLLDDIPGSEVRRGDRLSLRDSKGQLYVPPRITGVLAAPLSEENRGQLELDAARSERRTHCALGVGFAVVGGIIVEGVMKAPIESLFATGVVGAVAAVYGLRQSAATLDYDARAHSPQNK